MEGNPDQERRQAHAYLDHRPDAQVSAVRVLLEAMLDPASRALATTPEDEEISAEEDADVARSKEWFKHNQGTPFERVVSELSFTMDQVRNNKDDPTA
jgi:hypothetical protein